MHVERESTQLLLENEHGFWTNRSKWRKLFFSETKSSLFQNQYFVTKT